MHSETRIAIKHCSDRFFPDPVAHFGITTGSIFVAWDLQKLRFIARRDREIPARRGPRPRRRPDLTQDTFLRILISPPRGALRWPTRRLISFVVAAISASTICAASAAAARRSAPMISRPLSRFEPVPGGDGPRSPGAGSADRRQFVRTAERTRRGLRRCTGSTRIWTIAAIARRRRLELSICGGRGPLIRDAYEHVARLGWRARSHFIRKSVRPFVLDDTDASAPRDARGQRDRQSVLSEERKGCFPRGPPISRSASRTIRARRFAIDMIRNWTACASAARRASLVAGGEIRNGMAGEVLSRISTPRAGGLAGLFAGELVIAGLSGLSAAAGLLLPRAPSRAGQGRPRHSRASEVQRDRPRRRHFVVTPGPDSAIASTTARHAGSPICSPAWPSRSPPGLERPSFLSIRSRGPATCSALRHGRATRPGSPWQWDRAPVEVRRANVRYWATRALPGD